MSIVYIPDVYFMWGPSDLVSPDLKKMIDEINRNINKNFDWLLSFFFLLNIYLISKTPDKIINNNAFVCLVDLSEKGFGNSIPIK